MKLFYLMRAGRRLEAGALAFAAMLSIWSQVWGQVTPPGSHPGSLPGQPTSSILIAADQLETYRQWWANPVSSIQQAWKNNIVATANSAMALAAPGSFTAVVDQSKVAQARALRWLMDPHAATAADDRSTVVSVLSQYALVTGGTSITNPEAAQNYFQAFDYLNAGLNASERSAITTRLSGSSVLGQLSNPLQINNQQLKQASTRAFAALLFNNDSEIDTQMNRIRSSLSYNSTNDGGYTDGLRYLNYSIGQFVPFLVAYKNHTGINLGQYVEPFVRMGLGMRMPNGLTPSAHNNDNTAVAIHMFSQLLGDSALKNAALWNLTELGSHGWTGYTNVFANDGTYADFFALTDFSSSPIAPDWSPTYFSGGQAQITTFRKDWGKTSHYINLSAGLDGASIAGFTQYDTGALTIGANGTQVLVEPGYNRSDLSHSPSGFDPTRAIEHNILLARDTGNSSWGIGNGNSQTNTGTTCTTTNRLDSGERGNFKGVADFVTLRSTYGGSSAGNDVQARRSAAFIEETYFVVADSARRTDSTNKDFAVNLIGKSSAANTQVMVNTGAYMKLRWAVDDYNGDGYNGRTNTVAGYPYNQPQNGQVIAHIVASNNGTLSLAQDTTWMMETYDYYQQTQRMRVAMTNVGNAAFLTIMELGHANEAGRLEVTSMSGSLHAGARVVNAGANWTDWIISQTSASNVHSTAAGAQISIDGGALDSDAQFAWLRRVGTQLESAMLSRGTNLSSQGQSLLSWNNPVTASFLFMPNEIRGTLSADDLVADTILTLYASDFVTSAKITSATLNGIPVAFANAGATRMVTMAGITGGDFVIITEPASLGTPGDLNHDGTVNNQDIAPFVLALTDQAAWQTAYPALDLLAVGDINGDATFNNQDIAPFVALLTGGGNSLGIDDMSRLKSIPEPASLSLLAICCGLMLTGRRGGR